MCVSSLLGLLCLPGCWPDVAPERKFIWAKYLYLLGFTLTAAGTWTLRDYASKGFSEQIGAVADFCGGPDIKDPQACAGGQIAMRISFANFCFFFLHAFITFAMTKESDIRVDLHAGMWAFKILVWCGTLVGFFFVPNRAILGYAQVARISSGLFLVLQLILLIHLIYEINEWLVEKESRPAWAVLVAGAIAAFGLGLTVIGFSYHLYTASPTCRLNLFFCSFSIVVGAALVAILFVPNKAPSAGLLTSGAVFLYCSYLLLSALSSEPTDDVGHCLREAGASPRWIQIVGFFIALATVIYSTFTAGVASRDMFGNTKADDGMGGLLPYRADFFHVVFALASCYLAMLFSNWEVSPNTKEFELDRGWISTWVKMGSKWCCELLYSWTVVAPALFPHRDFGP